ncbi:MAG TPA: hypothetical protein VF751_00440 [Chthoniobacterales bacterium]
MLFFLPLAPDLDPAPDPLNESASNQDHEHEQEEKAEILLQR